MTEHGKNEALFREPENEWNTETGMEKSAKYLGLETTVSGRNQITIPLRLMHEFSLRAGDKIRFLRMVLDGRKLRISAEISREGRRLMILRIQGQLQSR